MAPSELFAGHQISNSLKFRKYALRSALWAFFYLRNLKMLKYLANEHVKVGSGSYIDIFYYLCTYGNA
jgi:hypothetical protein